QLFPVSQYRANSVAVQRKGVAKKAMGPKRLTMTPVTAANTAGNTATIIVTHSSRTYASTVGNPAYVIGAYVSHQLVPKKNTMPKIHPNTNDAPARDSRPIAISSGTSPTKASGQISKSGNASISSTAAATASSALLQAGRTVFNFPNFIP